MSLFKANYSYKLKTLLILKQVKKISELVKDIAQVYMKEVFSRHRVPNKIILDKDTRFILAF